MNKLEEINNNLMFNLNCIELTYKEGSKEKDRLTSNLIWSAILKIKALIEEEKLNEKK